MTRRRRAARRALTAAVAGVAGVAAWSLAEAAAFRLRRVEVPLSAPPRPAPLRVLHLSDLHIAPWQRRKQAWLRGLAALEPDLTVVTGDFLGHRAAVPVVADALGPLLERPGAFVLGSNDHVAPRLGNPGQYLLGTTARTREDWTYRERLPTGDLVRLLTERGWRHLDNDRDRIVVSGALVDLVGVDDPHHGLDRMPAPSTVDRGAVRLGVAHAPYRRILDAMTADGAHLVLAGHTHGGQVCVPGWGAVVTNCDLEPRYAHGLFAWSVRGADPWAAAATAWVHVSAGVGTSPWTPVRLACPPGATLLTLR
jgi:predicted MPP superfamily phosphohydrolase